MPTMDRLILNPLIHDLLATPATNTTERIARKSQIVVAVF